MASWSRVSQIEIPIAHEFRPLTDEEKNEFLNSINADSEKISQQLAGEAVLPLVEPIS